MFQLLICIIWVTIIHCKLLSVSNLNAYAKDDGKHILKGINLDIMPGEIHVIMGPNGCGKSTLAKVLSGHPAYDFDVSEFNLDKRSLIDLEPHERSHLGLFMAFQSPPEIPGVLNEEFLRASINAHRKANGQDPVDPFEFYIELQDTVSSLGLPSNFLSRNVNEGFSGGERKRNELLQMKLLKPKLIIMDEADSGLDVDALKMSAYLINNMMANASNRSIIIITHYRRVLDLIKPSKVHIMLDGRIVKSGGIELADMVDETGFKNVNDEF